jgi:hypothetical protein
MNNETQFSSLVESEAEPRPFKKEGWPEFPFNHWQSIKKWNMSSLRDIAGHLAEKTEGRRQRSGFLGQPSQMERQLIEHLGALEQQVFVLTDVVQASLQIIDDQRMSQRAKRAVKWIWERVKKLAHRVQQSTLLTILGFVSLLAFLLGALVYLFHIFRK